MAQIGFFHDMTRCTGCKACQSACKDKNNLEIGIIYRHAESYEMGKYPDVKTMCYTFSCNHCATPACLAVCPVGAIYKTDDDGTVIIDTELCDGCKKCLDACPYSVPQFNDVTAKAGKCDGCYWLRKYGEDVACASTCPNRALYFGTVDELRAEHGQGVELTNEFPILGEADMTMPSLLLKLKPEAQEAGFMQSLF
jgi:anaerobic dimethyl sulfoxide reductase subunit B (iron-sulfur subunit)